MKMQILISGSGEGPTFCISKKFPGDPGPRTTLQGTKTYKLRN